ncbi:MAG: hypothetical protein KDD92_20860 [Caldilineaceae bacterium]|nr:hypothetical protein [Caldilineaceae bacterium]
MAVFWSLVAIILTIILIWLIFFADDDDVLEAMRLPSKLSRSGQSDGSSASPSTAHAEENRTAHDPVRIEALEAEETAAAARAHAAAAQAEAATAAEHALESGTAEAAAQSRTAQQAAAEAAAQAAADDKQAEWLRQSTRDIADAGSDDTDSRDAVSDAADAAADKVQDASAAVVEGAKEAADAAGDAIKGAAGAVSHAAQDAGHAVQEGVEHLAEKTKEAADHLTGKDAGDATRSGAVVDLGASSLPASDNHPDDLTKVNGIGGVYQGRLYNAGVFTWAQIAALTPAELEKMTDAIEAANVTEWPAEASVLAVENGRVDARYDGPMPDTLTDLPTIGDGARDLLRRHGIVTYRQLIDADADAVDAMLKANSSRADVSQAIAAAKGKLNG